MTFLEGDGRALPLRGIRRAGRPNQSSGFFDDETNQRVPEGIRGTLKPGGRVLPHLSGPVSVAEEQEKYRRHWQERPEGIY